MPGVESDHLHLQTAPTAKFGTFMISEMQTKSNEKSSDLSELFSFLMHCYKKNRE